MLPVPSLGRTTHEQRRTGHEGILDNARWAGRVEVKKTEIPPLLMRGHWFCLVEVRQQEQ